MKRIGYLFEKITAYPNLLLATKKAARGKRVQPEVSDFLYRLESELFEIKQQLDNESYTPGPYRVFLIRDPKVRKISAPAFRDRVVHHAICNILEPIFEKKLIYHTYACRQGKGTHAALKECQQMAQRCPYFLKCDIQSYFETIDHEILKSLLTKGLKDKKLLRLLFKIIDQAPVGLAKGIPIGNLTSQYFANLYLGELDHFIKEELRVGDYLRYMDDFILFGETTDELKTHLGKIKGFVENELKIKLKDKVTQIASVRDGVPFLGYRVFPGTMRLLRKNLVRYRRKIHTRQREYFLGKISEKEFIMSIQSLLGHMSHGNVRALLRKEFLKELA